MGAPAIHGFNHALVGYDSARALFAALRSSDRLQLLATDTDFLILTPLGQEPPDTRRAPLAAFIMLGVVVAVMLGYAPISIAAARWDT